jgi:ribosomal protein L27
MAVKQNGITTGNILKKFTGLTTDVKPTQNVGNGSEFTELDESTRQVVNVYVFHDGYWYKY